MATSKESCILIPFCKFRSIAFINLEKSIAKFNSPKDFILYHAKLLNTSYLNPKGTYYEGPAAVDILIHYWGNPDLSSRNKYVGYVKTRAQAIIKGLS